MSIKTGEKLTWGATALLAVLRVLQYVFVLDEEGFFIRESLMQQVLSYALYVAMGLFVLLSLFVLWNKKNGFATDISLARKRGMAWAALLYAVSLFAYSVVLLWGRNWMAVLTLGAGVYYILLALRADRSRVPMLYFMSVFALAYPCARVIYMFFDTFKEVKASQTVISVVGMCAMILAVIVLTKLFMQFDEKMSKVAWCFMMCGAFGFLSVVASVLNMAFTGEINPAAVAITFSDLVFWFMIMICLRCCVLYQPRQTTDEEVEIEILEDAE